MDGRLSAGVSSLILKSVVERSGKLSGIEGIDDVDALECWLSWRLQ